MRLLDKYLLRELLLPLGYCLVGFTIFWVAFDLFARLDDLHDAKLSAVKIAEYYALRAPEFFVLVMPVAQLLGILYALTNLSRHNELTAMRAAGISLWRLSAPYFVIGLLFAVGSFGLNEFWVPKAAARAERIVDLRSKKTKHAPRDVLANHGFNNTRDHRTWQIRFYNLKTAEMIGPKIYWTLPDGSRREIYADRAWWTNGSWVFTNVQMIVYEAGNTEPTNRLFRPLLEATEFDETPAQFKSEMYIVSNSLNANRAEVPLFPIIEYLKLHPHLPRQESNALHTQLHARLASPFTCLVVVLIAIPFGAPGGRRNVFVGVASSIFIGFTYFVVQAVSVALGTKGALPPWLAAWLPNLGFAFAGFWLMRRVR